MKNLLFILVLVVITVAIVSVLPDGSSTPSAWLGIVRNIYGG